MSESVDFEEVYEAGDTTVSPPEDFCYVQSNTELETDLSLASYGVFYKSEN